MATGLSGLYSVLPRKLQIETDDWHRLTPDDVNEIPELTQLMDSLEFCNAVAQVAHPSIQKQLLEFLYQGFLVPVMGPALLQASKLGYILEFYISHSRTPMVGFLHLEFFFYGWEKKLGNLLFYDRLIDFWTLEWTSLLIVETSIQSREIQYSTSGFLRRSERGGGQIKGHFCNHFYNILCIKLL